MPAWSDHLALAGKCRSAHETLLVNGQHSEWVAAIVFYEALHLVEAVAASDPQLQQDRAVTHLERREFIYKYDRFKLIRLAYKELHRASLIARYMEGGSHATERFFAAPNLHQLVVVGWLGTIRRWAATELKIPDIAKPAGAAPTAQ